MKLLFLSDLHLDINANALHTSLFPILCEHIEKNSPNIVIVSGDTGNYSELVSEYFNKLNDFFPTINFYFIFGNHDISSDCDSLKEIEFLKENQSFLHNQAISLNDNTILIGWAGWYDYTFKEEYHFLKQIISTKKNHWYDSRYIHLMKDDITYYQEQFEQLETLLENNKDKNIILSTHFIPYKEFVTYKSDEKLWNLCNSFMGSIRTGELLDKYPNIQTVVFGHTHKRFGLVEHKNKQIICNPLGYKGEWSNNNPSSKEDILKELEAASIYLNI